MLFLLLTCYLGQSGAFEDTAQWWRAFITDTSELTLSNGKFVGNVVDLSVFGNGKVEVYTGVPYGVVDRFHPPIPVSASNETFSATTAATPCFQIFYNGRTNAGATEDCLTVDLYIPQSVAKADRSKDQKAGILFWIHGGGFVNGGAYEYEGINQAARGNIVVIIQYRLSVFGFLNMFDENTGKTVGGNYGLMDQQLALKYISENAENMWGDKTKITINGESAGGMSVALQLLNPTSANYIFAAIAQSGVTNNAFLFEKLQNSNQNLHTICKKSHNCQESQTFRNTVEEAEGYLEEMKNMTAMEIWNAADHTWAIVVGPVPTDGTFFTSDPRELIRTNTVPTNIPYFITTNSFEGSLLDPKEYTYGKFSLIELAFKLDIPDIEKVSQETLEVYNAASDTNVELPLTYQQELALGGFIYGDFMFRSPAKEEANAYANSGADVYVLYFDMDSVYDIWKSPPDISCCGVPHGIELLYTFSWLDPFKSRGWETSLSDYISNQYENIVKTGSPESDWPKYGENQHQLVLRNTQDEGLTKGEHQIAVEDVVIPKASSDAIEYWKKVAESSAQFKSLTSVLWITILVMPYYGYF